MKIFGFFENEKFYKMVQRMRLTYRLDTILLRVGWHKSIAIQQCAWHGRMMLRSFFHHPNVRRWRFFHDFHEFSWKLLQIHPKLFWQNDVNGLEVREKIVLNAFILRYGLAETCLGPCLSAEVIGMVVRRVNHFLEYQTCGGGDFLIFLPFESHFQ